MIFRYIIELGKVLFLSPYMNFNLVFSLHLAKYALESDPYVHIFYELDIPTSLFNVLSPSEAARVRITKNLYGLEINEHTLIIINNRDMPGLINLVGRKVKKLYIFTPKLGLPKNIKDIHICKVLNISAQTYLLRIGMQKHFIKVAGVNVEEVDIPYNVKYVVEELKELTNTFGSIKASDFIKYCVRKFNFSREMCIDLVRKALSMGLIKYANGYLLPV